MRSSFRSVFSLRVAAAEAVPVVSNMPIRRCLSVRYLSHASSGRRQATAVSDNILSVACALSATISVSVFFVSDSEPSRPAARIRENARVSSGQAMASRRTPARSANGSPAAIHRRRAYPSRKGRGSAAGGNRRSRSSFRGQRPIPQCSRSGANPGLRNDFAGAIRRRNHFHGQVRSASKKRPHAAGRNAFGTDKRNIRTANGIGVVRHAKSRFHRHQAEFPGPDELPQSRGNVQHDTPMIKSRRRHRYKFSPNQFKMLLARHFE